MSPRFRPSVIAIAPIRLYQRYLSPVLPATCRYTPSCSAYAVEALQVHGLLRGLYLTVRRLLRCQPWSKRAPIDPVPPKGSFRWEPRAGAGSSTVGEMSAVPAAVRVPDSPVGSLAERTCS